VLVVQEELLLRMGVADTFEAAGFKIVEATSGDEAVRVLQREPAIRVVFTDINLPGTRDGLALAHYVRHRWPPTILSSGRVPLGGAALPSKAEFVPKYVAGRLAKAVQGIVSQIAGSV